MLLVALKSDEGGIDAARFPAHTWFQFAWVANLQSQIQAQTQEIVDVQDVIAALQPH